MLLPNRVPMIAAGMAFPGRRSLTKGFEPLDSDAAKMASVNGATGVTSAIAIAIAIYTYIYIIILGIYIYVHI